MSRGGVTSITQSGRNQLCMRVKASFSFPSKTNSHALKRYLSISLWVKALMTLLQNCFLMPLKALPKKVRSC